MTFEDFLNESKNDDTMKMVAFVRVSNDVHFDKLITALKTNKIAENDDIKKYYDDITSKFDITIDKIKHEKSDYSNNNEVKLTFNVKGTSQAINKFKYYRSPFQLE